MPTISVNRDKLFERLKKEYTIEEFQELCFSFGIELDEEVTEVDNGVEKVVYKIEVPANRYDLLCFEGLARSLAIFMELEPIPIFQKVKPLNKKMICVNVRKNTARIRPFIAAAVLRNVTFDEERYRSFIDLQEKLHQNLCRKRTLVAIGTHDLDTIKEPFFYDAVRPDRIKFRPLNEEKDFTAVELMTHYETNNHLKQYLPILKDKKFYPLITDSNGVVLSLPPIINGDHSKITVATKNVFIECTGTDNRRVKLVLNVLVTMFSEYCNPQYNIEACLVNSVLRGEYIFPVIYSTKRYIHLKRINNLIGVKLSAEEIQHLLKLMGLNSSYVPENRLFIVEVPPTRSDILNDCDVIEDIAIAYGYNNIKSSVPEISHVAKQIPLNRFTDILRETVTQAGFLEILTFSLCSRDDIGKKLNLEECDKNAVHVANPKTLEFQVVRTTLLPGLLKSVYSNKMLPLPLKVFEVSDIVVKHSMGVGAVNKRYLGALYCSKEGNFEKVHGLLDRIMLMLEIPWKDDENGYCLKASDNVTYFPKRCAQIMYKNRVVGHVGILHPNVLKHFDIPFPCSYLELDIEHFRAIYS